MTRTTTLFGPSRPACLAMGLLLGVLPAASAAAQAVQQPVFQSFSGSTTVLVPDGGGALLGGVNSSAAGRALRGFPGGGLLGPLGRSRGMGVSTGASNMSVHATIIDLQAMDEAILASAPRGYVSPYMSPVDARGRYLGEHVARHAERESDGSPLESSDAPRETASANSSSIASIHREHAAADAALQAEAAAHWQKAEQCLAEGKPGPARVYYQMALRRAQGELKADIAKRLGELNEAYPAPPSPSR